MLTMVDFNKMWEVDLEYETCLHPAAPSGCSDAIIQAHTVQRMGGGLKSIATEGHVYGLKLHPYFFQKNDMRVMPELVGTRKASTFRGFCSVHDAELFKPVEQRSFDATKEQLLLMNFRVIARRLYEKTVALRRAPRMFDYDRGLPPRAQREWFAVQYRHAKNIEEALTNVSILKAEYDRLISRMSSECVNALVVHFSGPPDFMCAEIAPMEFDFMSRQVHEPPPPAHLCSYTVTVGDSWNFVLSWAGTNPAAEQLCRSFIELSDDQRASAVLRFALEYTDNLFFAPAWWDALDFQSREEMITGLTYRFHPDYERAATSLTRKRWPDLRSSFAKLKPVGSWLDR